MTFPSITLGMVIALLYGSLFHAWRGGNPMKWVLYLIFSLIGFWGGHWLADLLAVDFASYGPLHLGPASLASLVALFIGGWLSDVESVRP